MSMILFQKLAESSPEKYPKRMGQKWDDAEVLKLLTSLQKNKPIYEIATEHQRTHGSIRAKQCKLAEEYYFNDEKPIEEIAKITRLQEREIENIIEKKRSSYESDSEKSSDDMKEILFLLKDISAKLSIVIESNHMTKKNQ